MKNPECLHELRGKGMPYEEDINSIRQFHDQLKPYKIKTWNSSESLPEEVLQQFTDDGGTRSEQPRAEEFHPVQQISDKNELPKETPHIRISHFVDGSPRTVNTGFLLGTDGISYPVALAHVGAAAVAFDKGKWYETGFVEEQLILVAHKRMRINFEIRGKWKLEDPTDNIEENEINKTDLVALRSAAIRRARRKMAVSERDLVHTLANNFPEDWIAIDGTLFTIEGMYSDLKDSKIIGISKSFELDPIVMKGSTPENIGYLIRVLTELPVGWRSPVYRLTPDINNPGRYTYMWFVRIHEARQSPISGVVKVELPPSQRYHKSSDLRKQTVDAISNTIFRLRTPYLYDNRRGESFLYPVYVAESLVKSKLKSVEKIQGIWKSSQYKEEN